MTVNELISRIAILPPDATILSNSGWECAPTDIGGIWYNRELNEVHMTQGGSYEKERGYKKGFRCIYNYVDEEENRKSTFKCQMPLIEGEKDKMVKLTKCPCGELFDAKDGSFCPKCGCAYGELSGRYTNIGR